MTSSHDNEPNGRSNDVRPTLGRRLATAPSGGGKRRPRRTERDGLTIFVGVLVLAAAIGMLIVGYTAPKGLPAASHYTLEAEFTDADNIAQHSRVKVSGRDIGQVLSARTREGKAVLELQLDPAIAPLRSDTRMRIRPRSPLGVRFVDVMPGESGAPLADDDVIPAEQTSAAVPLDRALGVFDAQRRERTRTVLNELGHGLAGRGTSLGETIEPASEFLEDTGAVSRALTERPGELGGFVRSSGGALAALAAARGDLAEGFEPQASALRPLSTRSADFRATLAEAPPTLDTLTGRLPGVRRLAASLEGLGRELQPSLAAAPSALRQTTALIDDARPELRDLDATLDLADRAVPTTLSLLNDVDPLLPNLEGVLDEGRPLVRNLARGEGCDFQEAWRNFSSSVTAGNEAGTMLRLTFVAPSDEQFSGLLGPSVAPPGSNPYPKPCTAGNEGRLR